MEKSRRFRWGNDYLRNVTANSFEAYRVQEDGNGGYYGRYKYYYYDGVQWIKDTSSERELSDAECRMVEPSLSFSLTSAPWLRSS